MTARRLRNCLREEPAWLSGAEPDETESLRPSFIRDPQLWIKLPETFSAAAYQGFGGISSTRGSDFSSLHRVVEDSPLEPVTQKEFCPKVGLVDHFANCLISSPVN
jgi:hypothetical protein